MSIVACAVLFLSGLGSAVVPVQSVETPKACLDRLSSEVEALLSKPQPDLFAWHLRSIRALAQTEYAKIELGVEQSSRQPLATRQKEFVEFVGAMADGLKGDAVNPDAYLKEGRRSLVLARPSATDGSLQYFMVGLPADWDPAKEYPLFVGLHGSGPDNPLAYPSYGFGPQTPPKADAAKTDPGPDPTANMIHLTPWGRGNRSWRNDAERDLFEALTSLQKFAKLDRDRWYITGHSSGADGCWAIVQHTPDLWAAAGPQSGSMGTGRPEWGLIPNMIHVPIYFLIGEKDPLPGRVPDMKEAYQLLSKLGDDAKLNILPGIGHYPLTDEGLRDQAAWMVTHVRKRPSKFSFTVDDPWHPGVWGIHVALTHADRSRVVKEPWPSFFCEISRDEVKISTRNVGGMSIDLGPNGLQMTGDVRLLVDGKQIYSGPVPSEPVVYGLQSRRS